MGAQWKQKGREIAANKRGQLFGKLVKEIQVAAKMGGPHIDLNARLYAAVNAAKKQSVPADTIDRAIKKGAGLLDDGVSIEMVTYEGFAPHKVPVIVECLTDNRNRTAPEMRVLFKKGQFGSSGSVSFMFNHVGIVEATHTDKSLDLETVAIEAGAQEVEPLDSSEVPEGQIGARFICNRTDLDAVSKYVSGAGWNVTTSEMSYIAKNFADLSEAERAEVQDFLHAIDEHDDVHRVYAGLK